MIILVLLSLVLLGIAVALVARGVMVSRFRTVDTLEQIGYYGFAGTIELEPQTTVAEVFAVAWESWRELPTWSARSCSSDSG